MKNIVDLVLEKYHLQIEEYVRKPDNGSKRSYIIFVTNPHGQKLTLKLFDSDDVWAHKRFLAEISNIRQIKNKLRGKYKNWVPTIKFFSTKGENPYYIYERVEGDLIGQFVEDYGILWGKFKHRNFVNFIEFFDHIQTINLNDDDLPTWGSRNARKELQFYFEQVHGLLPSDLYDKVNAFFEKNAQKIAKYTVFSHRDLYPENIIQKTPGSSKFCFIDWEYLSKVPLGYDAAFLYLLFWREEYWKSKVFAFFHNKYSENPYERARFLVSFRFCLIILATRFLYQIHTYGKANEDVNRHARLSFIYDIGLALSGDIVKPRNIKFLIDLNDIQKVCDEYGVGKVRSYEIFYASKGNTVAKVVTASGTYVARFYSISRSASLIKRELNIFERLRKNGIATYDIIRTLDNKLYLEKELYGKTRKIALLTFVKGKKIQRKWANEKAIYEVGAMLRSIHNQNIVHGDYSKENVLFNKTCVSGVIDFEWGRFTTSREAKYHDLAKAVALWLVDTRYKLLSDADFVKYFISGYMGGKSVKADLLNKIYAICLEKIQNERSVFMTTLDSGGNKFAGSRFEHAEEVIRALILP